jgi:prepilin peptidase CpaA
MQNYNFIETGIYIALGFTLLWAAGSDLKYRRISNSLTLLVLVLFALSAFTRLASGYDWSTAVLWPIVSASIIFAIGLGLFAARLMGGGDVKIMSATALFAGPALSLPFVLYVTLAGGVVALATMAHARIKNMDVRTAKVPYGVAITFGGLWVCFQRFTMG